MTANQEELLLTIGSSEAKKQLEAKAVVIKAVNIEEVGTKKAKKVVCQCLHPDAEDLIKISAVKLERQKGKLEVIGLWLNKVKEQTPEGEKERIQKGSALADFLAHKKAPTIFALIGQSCDTILDENGYLCFKAY